MVVLLCIIGAGALVLIGYATSSFFVGRRREDDNDASHNDFSQAEYMREVRLRNQSDLQAMYGYGRRG